MAASAQTQETEARRAAMLNSAFSPVVRAALDDPETTEIMANADGAVWIERTDRGMEASPALLDATDRERVIRLVASWTGEAVTRISPIVSGELPGSGARFEGLLPPVAIAPVFSIRKPAASPLTLDDFVRQGALSPGLCAALRETAAARRNILIAGGTSSGKTTFANALLKEPAFEASRLVILEDTRELRCRARNIVQLKTAREDVTLRALVRSTLRLRPDRIVVGEVRGAEALDLLKAWNTGHPGGITTLHANSARGALTRLEQLTLEAARVAPQALIAEAVDIVVFMSRASGARRVEEALRVSGHDGRDYCTAPLLRPVLTPALIIVNQGDYS